MIIQGARLVGGRYQDEPSNLVQYLDAADYGGSGSTWPARIGSNATLYASPTWSASNGGYFTFSPASLQYADTPNLGNFSTWTIEVWFNMTAALSTTQATSVLTTVYEDGAGTFYGQINYCMGNNWPASGYNYIKPGYYNAVNAGWHETNGWTPVVGTWYQAVGTFDGTTINSYVNGGFYASAAGDGASNANGAPTRIARRWDGPPGDPSNFFPGSVAIVKIYNEALNASQVSGTFNANRSRFGI